MIHFYWLSFGFMIEASLVASLEVSPETTLEASSRLDDFKDT